MPERRFYYSRNERLRMSSAPRRRVTGRSILRGNRALTILTVDLLVVVGVVFVVAQLVLPPATQTSLQGYELQLEAEQGSGPLTVTLTVIADERLAAGAYGLIIADLTPLPVDAIGGLTVARVLPPPGETMQLRANFAARRVVESVQAVISVDNDKTRRRLPLLTPRRVSLRVDVQRGG